MSKTVAILMISWCVPALWAQETTDTTSTATTVSAAASRVIAPRHVDAGFMYQRVYARVPMIGTGTGTDPRRPMFAPVLGASAVAHSGILSFQMQLSDDGQYALCEFVGATLKDLNTIISSTDPNVKVFIRGKDSPADILAEFQKYSKNFTFQWFTGRPQ